HAVHAELAKASQGNEMEFASRHRCKMLAQARIADAGLLLDYDGALVRHINRDNQGFAAVGGSPADGETHHQRAFDVAVGIDFGVAPQRFNGVLPQRGIGGEVALKINWRRGLIFQRLRLVSIDFYFSFIEPNWLLADVGDIYINGNQHALLI